MEGFKLMKKIITAVLAVIAVTLGTTAFAETWNDSDIMPLLDTLGIIQGDGSGDYRLDDYVSREEMAKIAVNSSSHKDETAVGLKVSPFKDIDASRWSSAYILNGTRNGLFNGYLDGTFKPYDTVTYEEAVTMMLRVIGYSDDEFGISYPYGQVNKAVSLKMTDNVNSDYGYPMTRRQVARLVYNTLTAQTKTGGDLINIFDAQIVEDAIIIATSAEDSSLGSDKVYTTSGKYTKYDGFSSDYVGKQGDMVIKNQKDLICFVPDTSSSSESEKYVIYSVLNDAVVGYKNGSMSQIDIKSSTTCYKGTMASTYAAVKGEMEMGDILRVRRDNKGDVDYVVYSKGNMEGPIKVTSADMVKNYIKNSSTQVMRDGNKVTSDAVSVNDVIYYSDDLNMLLAYSEKATGIYESASPSRDQPNSITISGKTYSVESAEAFNDLSSSGPFRYGDTITVILGKNGAVAGVVTSSETTQTTKYGLLVEAGKKNFTNNDGTTYSSYYADIIAADGVRYEYAVSNDCSSYLCSVVKASFENGKTTVRKQNGQGGASGKVDAADFTIGGEKVADDCKIIDTIGYYNTDTPIYKSVYLQRLDGMTLTSSNVRYSAKNANGEISELILLDATGDCYEYGLVTSGNSKTNTYKVDIDGVQYQTESSSGAYVYTPCKALVSGGALEIKSSLKSPNGTAKNLTQSTIEINGTEYKLSDKVVVYTTKAAGYYNKASINDVINGDYSYTVYYDKPQSEGGRIRVIIAK